MHPKVVYPDASEAAARFLSLPLGDALRLSAEFVLHLGKPPDDDDYVRRMGGARGMGWGPVGPVQAQETAALAFAGK